MGIGPVKPEIRERLKWLDLTPMEEDLLEFSSHTTSELVYRAERFQTSVAEEYVDIIEVNRNFLGLIRQERLFTLAELQSVADGEHPFYNSGSLKEAQPQSRLWQFFRELKNGYFAPAELHEFWQKLLEQADGDELQALVELEFHAPNARALADDLDSRT